MRDAQLHNFHSTQSRLMEVPPRKLVVRRTAEDSTQQDLLRKTVESQSILQTVASTQNTMVTKIELLGLRLLRHFLASHESSS